MTVLAAGCQVALARTSPPWDGAPAVREVERQFLDMIAAARRLLFFENQYFASRRVADALLARLAAPDCPEIVAIGPGDPINVVERSTMGVARAEMLARLQAADAHGRFGLYRPVVGADTVKVHSKVMVVDDRILRIGSANLNNRSLGLDNECDLTLESLGDPALEAVVRAVRHDLVAEHLGVAPAAVAAAEQACGGLHAAIARLASGDRRLRRDEGGGLPDVLRVITNSGFPDPEAPIEALMWPEEEAEGRRGGPRRRRAVGWMAGLAGLALAAALWRWVPGEAGRAVLAGLGWLAALGDLPAAVAAAAGGVALGVVVRLPLPLLAFAAALALGPWRAMAAALAGGLAGAAVHYLLGRWLGWRGARRLAGCAIGRIAAALGRHGLGAIFLLRLLPIAAFAVTNLVAGAARMRFRDFALGTALGMAPGILAMSVLGDRVLAVLRHPSMVNIAVLGLATFLVIAAMAGLAGRLGRACVPRARP